MSEGDQNGSNDQNDVDDAPLLDARGRFAPGHKRVGGRRPGSENKYGPSFREKLIRGITKAGAAKAKRAGKNGAVDGLEFYITDLAITNSSAAATLINKLIPPEQPKSEIGAGVNFIIKPIDCGQSFMPADRKILAPFDEAATAWKAYNGGVTSWASYLEAAKLMWTPERYAHLCMQQAPEVYLASEVQSASDEDNVTPFPNRQQHQEAKLTARLESMSSELRNELVTLIEDLGIVGDDPDTAA